VTLDDRTLDRIDDALTAEALIRGSNMPVRRARGPGCTGASVAARRSSQILRRGSARRNAGPLSEASVAANGVGEADHQAGQAPGGFAGPMPTTVGVIKPGLGQPAPGLDSSQIARSVLNPSAFLFIQFNH
jgi:hypothetical protein